MAGFRPILAHGSRQSGWPRGARVVSLGRGTALVTAHISSRQNPLVARFKAAAEASDGSLLLDGAHLVSEALAAGLALECVALDPDRISPQERAALTRAVPAAELVTVSRAVLEAISPVRTPSGVVALAARPTHTLGDLLAGRSRLVLGAVDVQDPGNVGAIVRAAEAGGASGVVCTAHGADPFGWKALRGAMGSAFRLPVTRVPAIDEAIAAARTAGCAHRRDGRTRRGILVRRRSHRLHPAAARQRRPWPRARRRRRRRRAGVDSDGRRRRVAQRRRGCCPARLRGAKTAACTTTMTRCRNAAMTRQALNSAAALAASRRRGVAVVRTSAMVIAST